MQMIFYLEFLSEDFFSRAISCKDINCSEIDQTRDLDEVNDFVIRCMRDASIEFSKIPADFKTFQILVGTSYVKILIRWPVKHLLTEIKRQNKNR